MRIAKSLFFVALFLAVACLQAAEPQNRIYAVVDYMRVQQNHSQNDYLALEKVWQKLHRKAVDSGLCRGWYLVRLENGGRNEFATIRLYESPAKMLNPFPEELWKTAFAEDDMKLVQDTENIRHLTRSELWSLNAATIKTASQDGCVVAHFMKARPGMTATYVEIETTVWRKYHQARVDKGKLEAWYLMERTFPSGYDSDFDYVTLNVYSSKEASKAEMDSPESLGLKMTDEEMKRAGDIFGCRDLVREEIWMPVMKVEPKAAEQTSTR